jgi:hypothetical protein
LSDEGVAEVDVKLPEMQKVMTMQPLAAEIFSNCGGIKAGILFNLWKLSH